MTNNDNIVPFPRKFEISRRARLVRGREVWDQLQPPNEMVWEVCPYLRNFQPCMGCSKGSIPDEHYGPLTPGCWMTAQEACRVVFAMQKRLAPKLLGKSNEPSRQSSGDNTTPVSEDEPS